MDLSKRLQAVADLVTRGAFVADIGTDHAYIPIYLVKHNICKNVIAMDINKGPLLIADEHIQNENVKAHIETRLSDGFQSLEQGEVDTVIIAGMGGGLVMKILTDYPEITDSIQTFVLQPQSEIEKVRRFLHSHQFVIEKEDMIFEDGKYYPMMLVTHRGNRDQEIYEEIDYMYGKQLLQSKNEVLFDFLKKEERIKTELVEKLSKSGSEKSAARVVEIKQELSLTRQAKKYWE